MCVPPAPRVISSRRYINPFSSLNKKYTRRAYSKTQFHPAPPVKEKTIVLRSSKSCQQAHQFEPPHLDCSSCAGLDPTRLQHSCVDKGYYCRRTIRLLGFVHWRTQIDGPLGVFLRNWSKSYQYKPGYIFLPAYKYSVPVRVWTNTVQTGIDSVLDYIGARDPQHLCELAKEMEAEAQADVDHPPSGTQSLPILVKMPNGWIPKAIQHLLNLPHEVFETTMRIRPRFVYHLFDLFCKSLLCHYYVVPTPSHVYAEIDVSNIKFWYFQKCLLLFCGYTRFSDQEVHVYMQTWNSRRKRCAVETARRHATDVAQHSVPPSV